MDSVNVACWYVLMKLHKHFFGGVLAQMCRAFGRGLCVLGGEVFTALAALSEIELLPQVMGAAVYECRAVAQAYRVPEPS